MSIKPLSSQESVRDGLIDVLRGDMLTMVDYVMAQFSLQQSDAHCQNGSGATCLSYQKIQFPCSLVKSFPKVILSNS